ncbi:hypothetical protein ES708_16711 [subsurface metagenome]
MLFLSNDIKQKVCQQILWHCIYNRMSGLRRIQILIWQGCQTMKP